MIGTNGFDNAISGKQAPTQENILRKLLTGLFGEKVTSTSLGPDQEPVTKTVKTAPNIVDQAVALPQYIKEKISPPEPQNLLADKPTPTESPIQIDNFKVVDKTDYTPKPSPTATPAPTPRVKGSDVAYQNASSVVKSAIQTASEEFGVPPELLIDISFAESGLNPNNSAQKGGTTNPDGSPSSAAGLFMFIDNSWKQTMRALGLPETTPKTDPLANARAAAYQISKGNLGWWDASRDEGNKWGQYYTPEELAGFDNRLKS